MSKRTDAHRDADRRYREKITQILIKAPPDMAADIDALRGGTERAVWVKDLINERRAAARRTGELRDDETE